MPRPLCPAPPHRRELRVSFDVLLGGLLLAGGLTACAGGAVDSPDTGTYDPSMLRYVAGKGALYTQIVGNPFNASKDKVESVVTGTMLGAHFGPDVRFSTKRDPDNTSPDSVVLPFNPAPSVTAIQLCEGPDPQLATAASGETRVMLTFCASGYRETPVTGRISGVTDPDDAAFRGLIRQIHAVERIADGDANQSRSALEIRRSRPAGWSLTAGATAGPRGAIRCFFDNFL